MSRFAVAKRACVIAVAAVCVLAPIVASPATATNLAAPIAPGAPSAKTGRVIPLPSGRWQWSSAYGIAGTNWSSGHHTGQDFGAAQGTPILAAADGIVIFAGTGGAYGNLTQIQHEGSLQTWYAHQSAIAVAVGTHVKAGQVIGAVGSTGNSTGPHLHFEVRVNGAHVDPRAWLAGAPTVPVDGSAFDPALASQLRGELAEADAKLLTAQQEVDDINSELEILTKQSARIRKASDAAHRLLVTQIRTVYKSGIEPQWLVNVEALDAGDWRTFSDRKVLAEYTGNSQANKFDNAVAALRRADEHRNKVKALQLRAEATLSEAKVNMMSLQIRLNASQGMALAGTQFDGVIPAGGTPGARAAVTFALTQVGHAYNRNGGTGPTYGCNGFVWRAWHEAGSMWPVQVANDQALNTQWVVPIARGQEQPGDLVFWRLNNGTAPPGQIDHVGIVVNPEQGLFVHASSPRTGVEVNNYQSSSYYRNVAMFGRVKTLR